MNHLTTRSILSCSFAPSEIAAKRSGCSHQYAGNSVSEVGDRMTETQRQLPINDTEEWTDMVGQSYWIDHPSCERGT